MARPWVKVAACSAALASTFVVHCCDAVVPAAYRSVPSPHPTRHPTIASSEPANKHKNGVSVVAWTVAMIVFFAVAYAAVKCFAEDYELNEAELQQQRQSARIDRARASGRQVEGAEAAKAFMAAIPVKAFRDTRAYERSDAGIEAAKAAAREAQRAAEEAQQALNDAAAAKRALKASKKEGLASSLAKSSSKGAAAPKGGFGRGGKPPAPTRASVPPPPTTPTRRAGRTPAGGVPAHLLGPFSPAARLRRMEQGRDEADTTGDLPAEGVKTQKEYEETVAPCCSADDEGEVCSICLCEMEADDAAKELRCFHCFHADCLDRWLRLSTLCPLCKGKAVALPGEEVNAHSLALKARQLMGRVDGAANRAANRAANGAANEAAARLVPLDGPLVETRASPPSAPHPPPRQPQAAQAVQAAQAAQGAEGAQAFPPLAAGAGAVGASSPEQSIGSPLAATTPASTLSSSSASSDMTDSSLSPSTGPSSSASSSSSSSASSSAASLAGAGVDGQRPGATRDVAPRDGRRLEEAFTEDDDETKNNETKNDEMKNDEAVDGPGVVVVRRTRSRSTDVVTVSLPDVPGPCGAGEGSSVRASVRTTTTTTRTKVTTRTVVTPTRPGGSDRQLAHKRSQAQEVGAAASSSLVDAGVGPAAAPPAAAAAAGGGGGGSRASRLEAAEAEVAAAKAAAAGARAGEAAARRAVRAAKAEALKRRQQQAAREQLNGSDSFAEEYTVTLDDEDNTSGYGVGDFTGLAQVQDGDEDESLDEGGGDDMSSPLEAWRSEVARGGPGSGGARAIDFSRLPSRAASDHTAAAFAAAFAEASAEAASAPPADRGARQPQRFGCVARFGEANSEAASPQGQGRNERSLRLSNESVGSTGSAASNEAGMGAAFRRRKAADRSGGGRAVSGRGSTDNVVSTSHGQASVTVTTTTTAGAAAGAGAGAAAAAANAAALPRPRSVVPRSRAVGAAPSLSSAGNSRSTSAGNSSSSAPTASTAPVAAAAGGGWTAAAAIRSSRAGVGLGGASQGATRTVEARRQLAGGTSLDAVV